MVKELAQALQILVLSNKPEWQLFSSIDTDILSYKNYVQKQNDCYHS